MAAPRDVVVIGAGVNGLVTACLLARSGLRLLVLERRPEPGGCAVTEEIHPGFRCPTLAHALPIPSELARDLELARHGLEMLRPDVRVFAPAPAGGGVPVVLFDDPARTAKDLARVSPSDAARWPAFVEAFRKIGGFLRPVLTMTPPGLDDAPTLPEAWRLLRLGKGFRDLGRKDAYRLLRWGPMAVADLAAEWFTTDLLKAVVAAPGIRGAFAGPWSAGTSLNLLMEAAAGGQPILPSVSYAGGPGALSRALAAAARAAGAEIRTGAEVARILTNGENVRGVALASGEEIPAKAVVSGADPKSTFLKLIDPGDLDPDFVHRMRNYRCSGSAAKINYALSALPRFSSADGADSARLLAGRIHIGASIDELEQAFDAAKYGGISPRPYMDITLPSVADPSLAPAGAHVMSVHAQFAPLKLRGGAWPAAAGSLAEAVERTLIDYVPDLPSLIVARQVITPADLEERCALSGGHILHGEPSLDQLFTMRPMLGVAQYRTPVKGLFLCGAGTHPGGVVPGQPGANAARELVREIKRG